MGSYFWVQITTWTFLCYVGVVRTEQDLQHELGLNVFPDVTKVNISQDEYTRMMSAYLHNLRDSIDDDSVPELHIFNADKVIWRRRKKSLTRLTFPNFSMYSNADIEQAELRMLVPPIPNVQLPILQIYQIVNNRRHHLLHESKAYLSSTASKWCEFDLTSGIRSIISTINENLGLEIHCPQCNSSAVDPTEAALSILVYSNKRRSRRSSHNYEQGGRTDCVPGDKKARCCRHTMTVTFKDLKVPHISSIIQPKSYEAGVCKGRCPYNYNHATNHSRIQSLVHKMDKKAAPRVCCAPSKLAPLDVLRVDPYDFTKLNLEKWDNMRVLECACS